MHDIHSPYEDRNRRMGGGPIRDYDRNYSNRPQPPQPIQPRPRMPSTMMVPAPLSKTNYMLQRSTVLDLVPVPPELVLRVTELKFQQILLQVKEQTGSNHVTVNRIGEDQVGDSIAIDAPSREVAQLARNLVETHFKLLIKLMAAENRLQKVQTDLFSFQGEIASGKQIEFTVKSDLLGLVIGKKGARIKQVEQETGVSSINVNGGYNIHKFDFILYLKLIDTGKIMIVGPDSQSVQQARESLELIEDSLPLSESQSQWLSDRFNGGVLGDIRTVSNLIVAKVVLLISVC